MVLVKKISAIIFISFILFVICDYFITSLNGYRSYSKFLVSNDIAGHINKPNFKGVFGGFLDSFEAKVNIGKLGERKSKSQNCNYSFNIIFLGDSGVAGFEVNDEETFVSQFNLKQCKYFGINFGVRAHNTHNVIGNYNRIKSKVKHSKVIYLINENDFKENLNKFFYRNLVKKFGGVSDGLYFKPNLNKFEHFYFKFRVFISDNFYVTTKMLLFYETRKEIFKKKQISKDVIPIIPSEEELNKMKELILKLGNQVKSQGGELYIAGYPCLYNLKCKTIYLEKILENISNKTDSFKIIPLANNLYKRLEDNNINPLKMRFRNDSHLSDYGHKVVSENFLNYLK